MTIYLVWGKAVFVGPWTEEEALLFQGRVEQIVLEEHDRKGRDE